MPTTCPCDLAAPYQDCCGRYHAGMAAPDARALMRSRYSAYVLGLEDYLLATWHESTRPQALDLAEDASTKWLGLAVKAFLPAGESATVSFVARYKVGGRAYRLVETSRFVFESGCWFYVDGDLADS
ncbi:YchJ family protein [Chitinibacteraceae bacterium HSL-7]